MCPVFTYFHFLNSSLGSSQQPVQSHSSLPKSTFDVIIVGLGAAGSAALYHTARMGATVLGIDRFIPPHIYGSTHSESRLIRKAYLEGAKYLPLLNRSYTLWNELEEKSSNKLMHLVGCLTISQPESTSIRTARNTAEIGKIRHLVLSPDEVRQRYPAYRLRSDQVALLDQEAGYIQPELCVRTHLQRAVAHGAKCQFGTPVLSCTREKNHVVVKTEQDMFTASQVILTAGSWIRDFAPVPVEINRVTNSWFLPTGPHCTPRNCPPFIMEEADGSNNCYGCSDLGYGFKIGLHHPGKPILHPDDLDRTTHPEDEIRVRSILKTILPEAAGKCLNTRVCMYSNTPDKDYLIDRLHGDDPHFIVGSACSGHGFKVSSAVGESLAALALKKSPPVDLSPFKWRWTLNA